MDLRAADDLRLLVRPDWAGVSGSFGSVAWSADGAALYAGGDRGTGVAVLRRRADGGRGLFTDLPVQAEPLSALTALPGGDVAWADLAGAWDVADGPPAPERPQHPSWGPPGELLVAPPAERVQFVLNGRRLRFSAPEHSTEPAGAAAAALRPPRTESSAQRVRLVPAGVEVNGTQVTLFGRLVPSRFSALGRLHPVRLLRHLGGQRGPHRLAPEPLGGDELRRVLAQIPGKALLWLDSCHAGGVLPPAALPVRFVNERASSDSGVVVFAAATASQASRESPAWQNGAFTRALVEGLGGRADLRRSGRVTLTALDLYVSERVRELTGGAQTPAVAKPGLVPDFPLALVR